ncbi:MAG: hypothetical protein ABIN91_12400 [Mucilaginibacter sp.]|uniref:hypothetical protein n=1 Tax=Mucilaginibacter sp. TaxID=1882438 RepID=UPI0032632763
MDGSIGIRLISRYNFTINPVKKEIHFVPNKTYHYPMDFVLGGYLMGYDTDGTLRIIAKVNNALCLHKLTVL